MIKTMELMGKKAKIIKSSNKELQDLTGIIIDETKNTITIESGNKTRKVLKKEVRLQITTPTGDEIIQSDDLVGRPEERGQKNKVKKRW